MNQPELTRIDSPIHKAYLIVHRGIARLEVVELLSTGRTTVGRAETCKVVLLDSKCSRQHCEVFYRNGSWHILDLESRNGVTVDGVRVAGEQPLSLGESIGIGACTMVLTDQHPDSAEATYTGSGGNQTADFEIIERKAGTQYDQPSGVQRGFQRKEGATELFRIARSIAIMTSAEALCQIVLDALIANTSASMGGILLTRSGLKAEKIEELVPIVVRGNGTQVQLSSFLTGIAFTDQEAILAHDITSHTALAAQESLKNLKAESAICAPIRHKGIILGVIHLYSLNASEPMSQDDLEFVLSVADQMGDQLYLIREKEQLEEDVDRSRRTADGYRDQLSVESDLIGHSESLDRLRRSLLRVAPTDALVLIRGESGVGKELVARAVHFNSHRRNEPFICVNCAALTESLLESELFGHEKGAFTGASSRRAGKFEQADGGTLFLDEIGEMSQEIQAKFLRVLEGQAFERVGGGDPIEVNVRVVTATNRDLEEAVREGSFRRDLFFRLQVIEVFVPPLREHPDDIPAIAQHFVSRFSTQAHRKVRSFNTAGIQKLQAHDWPGNVRELRNVVERAVILTDNEMLGPDDIVLTKLRLDVASPHLSTVEEQPEDKQAKETSVDPHVDLFGAYIQSSTSLDEIDRLYIDAVLKTTEWNKSKASRILQIERTTLDRRLKKYGIVRPDGTDLSDDDEEE